MAFTTHDNAPYLYRKSGGGGDLEIDKLVGGTIAWNQIIRNGNFADTSNWTVSSGSSFTVSNNVATFRADARYRSLTQSTPAQQRDPKLNHIYMGIVKAKSYTNTDTFFYVRTVASVVLQTASKTLSTTEKEYVNVLKVTQEAYYFQFMVQDNNASGYGDITAQNARFFDLTLMFGSTIADYVYSLEQSSQGSGLAWLRSYGFLTEDYYDYNAGELKSVSNLVSHDMTGKNLVNVNSSGITGAYIDANGEIHTSNAWSVSDFVPVMSGENYILSGLTSHPNTGVDNFILYDGGKNKVGNITQSALTSFTIPNGVSYVKFSWKNTEKDTVMFEQGSTATSYEPYTLHSYPLGDVTLRGLPKLNGNALYYDGDTYESNGTVTRKYGIVDLGTLNYTTWGSSDSRAVFTPSSDIDIAPTTSSDKTLPAICPKFSAKSYNATWAYWDMAYLNNGGKIGFIVPKNTYDRGTFKTAMNGVYLVYELATPTTETADTYTNPQWVDPNGTERYTLSANAFPMPIGHETTYNTDMGSKTVNTQVNLSMTEPSVRQIYAKEGDTARVLNIHLDQTEEGGTLRILRPDGTEVTADAVLVPDFYDGLMAEIPSDATEIVGKCYCDIEQNGVSSMPFTLNVKKNERES